MGQPIRCHRAFGVCHPRRFICRENGPSAQCGDCGDGPHRRRGRHHTGFARGQEAACAQGGNLCSLGRARRVNRGPRLGRGCRRFVCAVSCACGMPHLQLCVQVAPAESFLSYRSVKKPISQTKSVFFHNGF